MAPENYNKDILENLLQPDSFLSKINTLQEKLPPIIDDFKKYYILHNKNPLYQDYTIYFENIKANMNSINSEVVSIDTEVNNNIDIINEKLSTINESIQKEKEINIKLKEAKEKIKNKKQGSSILIDDYKSIYNRQYLNNFSILAGIIVGGYLLKNFTQIKQ